MCNNLGLICLICYKHCAHMISCSLDSCHKVPASAGARWIMGLEHWVDNLQACVQDPSAAVRWGELPSFALAPSSSKACKFKYINRYHFGGFIIGDMKGAPNWGSPPGNGDVISWFFLQWKHLSAFNTEKKKSADPGLSKIHLFYRKTESCALILISCPQI